MSSTKDLLALTQNILAETAQVNKAVPVGVDPIVDDGIESIVVPEAFVENAINFSKRLDEGTTDSHKDSPVQYINEAKLVEEKLVSLVERLRLLVTEAREVLQEATMSGMVGGPGVQKKTTMIRPPNSKKPSKPKGNKKG